MTAKNVTTVEATDLMKKNNRGYLLLILIFFFLNFNAIYSQEGQTLSSLFSLGFHNLIYSENNYLPLPYKWQRKKGIIVPMTKAPIKDIPYRSFVFQVNNSRPFTLCQINNCDNVHVGSLSFKYAGYNLPPNSKKLKFGLFGQFEGIYVAPIDEKEKGIGYGTNWKVGFGGNLVFWDFDYHFKAINERITTTDLNNPDTTVTASNWSFLHQLYWHRIGLYSKVLTSGEKGSEDNIPYLTAGDKVFISPIRTAFQPYYEGFNQFETNYIGLRLEYLLARSSYQISHPLDKKRKGRLFADTELFADVRFNSKDYNVYSYSVGFVWTLIKGEISHQLKDHNGKETNELGGAVGVGVTLGDRTEFAVIEVMYSYNHISQLDFAPGLTDTHFVKFMMTATAPIKYKPPKKKTFIKKKDKKE
jgi:hypothetical protein